MLIRRILHFHRLIINYLKYESAKNCISVNFITSLDQQNIDMQGVGSIWQLGVHQVGGTFLIKMGVRHVLLYT